MGDLIVMGPPGVGKGTQAKALAQQNGWVQLSTGEVFRDHIRRQTDLGRRVKAFLDQGAYVPDDVTVRMVRARLEDISPFTRVIFDGFPRTVAQAEALERLFGEMGRRVDGVLLLEAPRDELLARLTGRATAEGRSDDTPQVIARRLDVYEDQTSPLISYYDDRGLVKRVSGVGRVEDVTRRLREAVA
ncbi:MAG TPA: adenylate kinase [Candidatus Limnocylindria bacterium]|jgi:adenylate kinase|nr:adenylate kinase [Candidatus Limnocylindria bacterium]